MANPYVLKASEAGVVGDGSTDDTAAMQALFDAAELLEACVIFLDIVGTIKLTSTITLNDTATATYVSIEGLSEAKTILSWSGATNSTCLKISKNKYFMAAKFGVTNAVAEGTTVGIDLTGPADVGTQTHIGTFDHVSVTGFNIGIQCGHYTNFAVSEMVYRHLSLTSCGTGWKNGSLNTLNHMFEMLLISTCDIGLDISSGNAYVDGGAAADNVKDFKISNSGMTCEIANFRSEAGTSRTHFLDQTSSGHQMIRVSGCMIDGKGAGSDISIEATLGNTNLAIEDCLIDGKVALSNSQATVSSLTMCRNTVFGGITIYAPNGATSSGVILPFFVTGSNANDRVHVFLQGNQFHDVDSGTADFFYDDVYGGSFQDSGFFFPGLVRTNDKLPTDVTRLAGVTHLGQAPLGVIGKNLRCQGKFATSATLAFTFIRTASVDVTTGGRALASAAAFKISDNGRRVSVANADGAGGTFVGRITNFGSTSSVSVTKQTGSVDFVTGSGKTATIGEDEPDAFYLVFVTGDADERFSVMTKATTGFTVTSSNASSTANVDLLIVR